MNHGDLQDLPDEVRAEISRGSGETDELQEEALITLGKNIAKLRDEAVNARKESGIETTWMEGEDAYVGIDDENRAEFAGAKWAKSMTMDGPLVQYNRRNSSDNVRATAFIKLTSRYVDAGSAKVCEIALPIDGKPFTLKATPLPSMAEAAEDDTPAEQIAGQPMPGPDGQPVAVKDLAKHQIDKAEKSAEKACTRIYDWMVEYKHNAEMRKVIFDAARIGTGILKGPIPETSRATKVTRKGGRLAITMVEETKPVARWVDPWCFYPAPGCGEDVKKGGHAFEVDPMLAGELQELGRDGGGFFRKEAIAKVLKEGPGKCYTEGGRHSDNKDRKTKQFEVWHFHGQIPRAAFEAANSAQADELGEEAGQVFAIVTLVNDTVIRAVLQPLDSGRLPYHVFNWRRRTGSWAGVGVAEQVRTPQRIVNAAWRRLLNNAGQSSGSQVVVNSEAIEPASGTSPADWTITPDKLWLLRKDSGVDDVRKAFAAFQWPSTTPQLLSIIEAGYRMAEEHSSIPLITQGQSGDTTPDTFSGQQLQDNNANQLLRDVGFCLNDSVTTPLVDQMYEWLLLDESVPDDEKQDFKVDTSGALALIEKALQDQFIPQLVAASANPIYDLHPGRCMEGLLRTKRLPPEQFQLTQAEKDAKAQQPPPKDAAVQAAEIRAASAEKIAAQQAELAKQRNQNDLDRDRVYNEVLAGREAANYDYNLRRMELDREMAALELAQSERISLQEAKVKLATKTMELQTQRDLAGKDGLGPEVATPPTEPPGRAPDGAAYQA